MTYRLSGFNASPYSIKLRALLRYRRLPHVWALEDPRPVAKAHGLPPVMPVLQFPDGSAMNDSTPVALELERRHPDVRSTLPDDPGHRFLCLLLEDMADEWLTKCMYHYRWWYAPDRDFAALWAVGMRLTGHSAAEAAAAGQAFIDRQVGRMALVGSTAGNRPAIETTYLRTLEILAAALPERRFLFGTRPSLADFAMFGQLWTMAFDPTPAAIMRERAPRVLTWILEVDDASGVEGAWLPPEAGVPAPVEALLRLAGRTYLPFMAANAAAVASGETTVRVEILGAPFEQGVFRYQAKCLDALRKRFAALAPDARAAIAPVLEETGCLRHLA